MPDQLNNLERLLIDFKESLERDIQGIRESVDSLHTRFDTQAARMNGAAGGLDPNRQPLDFPHG